MRLWGSRHYRLHTLIAILVVAVLARTTALIPTAAQTQEPTQAPPITKVLLWHQWLGEDAQLLTHWITDYQNAHPDVQIDARYIDGDLRAQFADAVRIERGPDLFIGPSTWTGGLLNAQLIAILGTKIDQSFLAQATDVSWQNVAVNGVIYGVPESNQGVALYYNAALVTQVPATLDDLLKQPVLFAYDFYTTAGIYNGLGGQLINANDTNLLHADAALNGYLGLLKSAYPNTLAAVTPIPGDQLPLIADNAFRLGKVPFLIEGNWKLSDLREYLGDQLRVAALPTLANGKPWSPFVISTAFFISASANAPVQALDFMRYASGTTAQTQAAKIGQVPVNPNVTPDDSLLAAFAKQFVLGSRTPSNTAMTDYWAALDQAVSAVTVGKQPVDKTAQDVARTLNVLHAAPTITPTP